MKYVVQMRDVQVLKFIFAFRAVSLNQILRRHFPNVKKTTALRRLRKLKKLGLISVSAKTMGGKLVWYAQPQPKCWRVIKEQWRWGIENPHFKSESIDHDIRLVEVFLRLEKLETFQNLFTENLLQSSSAIAYEAFASENSRIQTDGTLVLKHKRGHLENYVFEFELNKKTPDQYRSRLTLQLLSPAIDGIFYVSSNPQVHSLLVKVEEEFGSHRLPMVWRTTEDIAKDPTQKLIIKNRLGEELEIK